MECSSTREAYLQSITRASLGEQVSSSLSSNKGLNSCELQLCCMGTVSVFTTKGASRRPPNSDYWQWRSVRGRWHLNNRPRRCNTLWIQMSAAGLCVSCMCSKCEGKLLYKHTLPKSAQLTHVAEGWKAWQHSCWQGEQPEDAAAIAPASLLLMLLLEAHAACSRTLSSIYTCPEMEYETAQQLLLPI